MNECVSHHSLQALRERPRSWKLWSNYVISAAASREHTAWLRGMRELSRLNASLLDMAFVVTLEADTTTPPHILKSLGAFSLLLFCERVASVDRYRRPMLA